MVMRKFLQATVLVFVIGSLASASAFIRDWEDAGDVEGLEGGMSSRGFVDERNQELLEENDPAEFVEVTISPKRKNFAAGSRRERALVPLQSKRVGDITDETAITGENAKKKLPSYVMQEQSVEPSFLHDINQVTASLIPMDSLGKTAG